MLARGATANLIFDFDVEMKMENISAIRLYINGQFKGSKDSRKEPYKIVKNIEDVEFLENNSLLVRLSQYETLGFKDCDIVKFQWHWRDVEGNAFTSTVEEKRVYEFLGSEVV